MHIGSPINIISFSWIICVLKGRACNNYNWSAWQTPDGCKSKKNPINCFIRAPLSVFRERQAEESRLVKLRLTTNYAFLYCLEVGCPSNSNNIFHRYKNNLLKTNNGAEFLELFFRVTKVLILRYLIGWSCFLESNFQGIPLISMCPSNILVSKHIYMKN